MFCSFKFKRLRFGLKNASSYFHALINMLLDEMQIEGIYVYHDDLIFGSHFKKLMTKLQKILLLLAKYNMTLSPSKCSFHKSAVDYLDFYIEHHTISPIIANIK